MICQHRDAPWPIEDRCTAEATHYLRDAGGKRIGVWCEKHANEIAAEYREKLGWDWTMALIQEEDR